MHADDVFVQYIGWVSRELYNACFATQFGYKPARTYTTPPPVSQGEPQ